MKKLRAILYLLMADDWLIVTDQRTSSAFYHNSLTSDNDWATFQLNKAILKKLKKDKQ